jgi:hypothetical protein
VPSAVLALAFFDENELVMVSSDDTGCHLVTLDYPSMDPGNSLIFSRSRLLAPPAARAQVAVNGRPGRRVGCVLVGDVLEVFDMDADEDEE